jgi:hypothetical protein
VTNCDAERASMPASGKATRSCSPCSVDRTKPVVQCQQCSVWHQVISEMQLVFSSCKCRDLLPQSNVHVRLASFLTSVLGAGATVWAPDKTHRSG